MHLVYGDMTCRSLFCNSFNPTQLRLIFRGYSICVDHYTGESQYSVDYSHFHDVIPTYEEDLHSNDAFDDDFDDYNTETSFSFPSTRDSGGGKGACYGRGRGLKRDHFSADSIV